MPSDRSVMGRARMSSGLFRDARLVPAIVGLALLELIREHVASAEDTVSEALDEPAIIVIRLLLAFFQVGVVLPVRRTTHAQCRDCCACERDYPPPTTGDLREFLILDIDEI